MASNFRSTYTKDIGTTATAVYGPVLPNTQTVVFGLAGSNTGQFPVTCAFYVSASSPSLFVGTVSSILSATQMTLSNVTGLALNSVISSTTDPNAQQTLTAAPLGTTITVGSTAQWGVPAQPPTVSRVFLWGASANTFLIGGGPVTGITSQPLNWATVPVGGSLVVLGSDRKLALQTGATIYAISSAPTSLDVTCSVLELT